jgi:hypothetical protein
MIARTDIDDFPLCENAEDGSLLRQPPSLTWKPISGLDLQLAEQREESRRLQENAFFGCWAGKTILLMGLGPSLLKIPNIFIKDWMDRKDEFSFWGTNNAPRTAKKIWGMVPPFEVNIAMDRKTDEELILDYQWDKRGIWFVNSRFHRPCLFGVRGTELYPTSILRKLFWTDSVTAGLSIAACALATETHEKRGYKRVVRANGGTVILLGVDMKNNVHAEPKPEDKPDAPYPDSENIIKAHEKLKMWLDRIGVSVFNANEDSAVTAWPVIHPGDL